MSPRPNLSKDVPIAPYRALPCYRCPDRSVAHGLHFCAAGEWQGLANEKACHRLPPASRAQEPRDA